MGYVAGKLVIRINELYCPKYGGWVDALRYAPEIHGIPKLANVRVVDPVTGEMIPQLDLTEDEYESLLAKGRA